MENNPQHPPKKILLHSCCASCTVYVHHILTKNYEVTCFFYNPNIHPSKEYESRKEEMKRIAALKNWRVIYGEYEMKEWFQLIRGHEKDPERGPRCSLCFHMRLEKTFTKARELGFDCVTSTLSISPYKVTRQINEEGEKLSRIYGIEFLPENFKKQNGYQVAKKMTMDLDIIHQNYCGCTYSKVERTLKIKSSSSPN